MMGTIFLAQQQTNSNKSILQQEANSSCILSAGVDYVPPAGSKEKQSKSNCIVGARVD
jgi:hypothetical protein